MDLTKQALHTTDTYVKKLREAGIQTLENFVHLFPRDLEDREKVITHFSGINIKEKQTIQCTIELIKSEVTRSHKKMIKAVLHDADGMWAEAVWFNRTFLLGKFHPGEVVHIYGMAQYSYGKLSFASPEIEHINTNRVCYVPIYSDVNYIPGSWIRSKMTLCKQIISQLPERVPQILRDKHHMRSYAQSVLAIHFPKSLDDFEQAKKELSYSELFHFQRTGLEKKYTLRKTSKGCSPIIPLDAPLMKELIASLPFNLTDTQKIVLFQILKDMEAPYAASRMLQGDVGTGKTVVALLVALHSILSSRKKPLFVPKDTSTLEAAPLEQAQLAIPQEPSLHSNGLQVACMAPTEILARQHFLGNKEWLETWGVTAKLLVGGMSPKEKEAVRAGLKNGSIHIVFGTHALIQENVVFAQLGFVIIDEQHRFGVEQRRILEERPQRDIASLAPHRLNMSATPIPRSLALTLYGDQDISVLNEYPKGRKMIHTRLIKETEREEMYKWIAQEVASGRQVYWISPLVAESETLEIASAKETYELLQEVFPDIQVGLIHGKMSAKEKDAIMQNFYTNTIQILSSTSVVEVGVDNPNATIICIEAAERFGLSQLHQFRGRVGRGVHQSYCYLFTNQTYKNDRLKALEQTNDGFQLAEIDLELRGPGEIYGVRQSGIPDLHFSDLRDVNLIARIRTDVEEWLQSEQAP